MDIIIGKKLNKIYSDTQVKVHAVKDIDIKIEAGEFVAIVGASGSGKSTLLHILGGLDKPDSGQVIINGTDIYDLSDEQRAIYRRRHIGFIFQFFNLIPVLNVRENIELPMSLDEEKINEEDFKEIVKRLGLEDRLKHLPSQLSGGEQQKTSIARALIYKPSIILADEPTGNLDKENSEEVLNILKLFASKFGITVVLITHDLNVAAKADRIIKVDDGKIYEGSETE